MESHTNPFLQPSTAPLSAAALRRDPRGALSARLHSRVRASNSHEIAAITAQDARRRPSRTRSCRSSAAVRSSIGSPRSSSTSSSADSTPRSPMSSRRSSRRSWPPTTMRSGSTAALYARIEAVHDAARRPRADAEQRYLVERVLQRDTRSRARVSTPRQKQRLSDFNQPPLDAHHPFEKQPPRRHQRPRRRHSPTPRSSTA